MGRIYLLTYTPKMAPRVTWDKALEAVSEGEYYAEWWSTGVSKKVPAGSRCLLLRQGDRHGIFGAGIAVDGRLEEWRRRTTGTKQPFFLWEFRSLVDPNAEELLDTELLKARFPEVNWTPRASGTRLPEPIQEKVWALWERFAGRKVDVSPSKHSPPFLVGASSKATGERPSLANLTEARQYQVILTRRERKGRNECLDHHGTTCAACGMSFVDRYGLEFERCIQVHHLRPISKASGARRVSPKRDLIPLCPNCHAVVHVGRDLPMKLDEVKRLLRRRR